MQTYQNGLSGFVTIFYRRRVSGIAQQLEQALFTRGSSSLVGICSDALFLTTTLRGNTDAKYGSILSTLFVYTLVFILFFAN